MFHSACLFSPKSNAHAQTARIACWFSKATTHWSKFCTRDGIDSQTVLRTIRESKIKNRVNATGFKPLSPIWGCSLDCSVPHNVQQFKTVCHPASTQNMWHRVIRLLLLPPCKTKESSFFPFSLRMRPFRQKILVLPIA